MFKGNPTDAATARAGDRTDRGAVRPRHHEPLPPIAATARRASSTALAALDVTTVPSRASDAPVPARRSVESSRRFRSLIKWRTGSEGRISHLKHAFGFERTVLDGIDGATTWCNWGLLAHNVTKIATLAEEKIDKSKTQHEQLSATAENHRPPDGSITVASPCCLTLVPVAATSVLRSRQGRT